MANRSHQIWVSKFTVVIIIIVTIIIIVGHLVLFCHEDRFVTHQSYFFLLYFIFVTWLDTDVSGVNLKLGIFYIIINWIHHFSYYVSIYIYIFKHTDINTLHIYTHTPLRSPSRARIKKRQGRWYSFKFFNSL